LSFARSLSATTGQVAALDKASDRPPIYPYWHQRQFQERNPKPV